ncbi:MAG: class I SAM-dependent methyltransferase [Adhaeribacter sp.]
MQQDVLGAALQDYLQGEKDAVILVHSDLTEPEELAAAQFFRDFKTMPELEQQALDLCRGKVADLGAGAGSHALVLQERKLAVTAYDISPGACQVMKERGVQQVVLADINHLGEEQYDTILMLMNGIGLVGDLEGLAYFLQQIKKNLKPGGSIIADSSDISYMFYDEDGYLCLNLNDKYHGVVEYEMAYKGQTGTPFNWLFIDFPLLEEYAQANGFECRFIQEDEHFHYLAELRVKQ